VDPWPSSKVSRLPKAIEICHIQRVYQSQSLDEDRIKALKAIEFWDEPSHNNTLTPVCKLPPSRHLQPKKEGISRHLQPSKKKDRNVQIFISERCGTRIIKSLLIFPFNTATCMSQRNQQNLEKITANLHTSVTCVASTFSFSYERVNDIEFFFE
jgi:hypothetical protein